MALETDADVLPTRLTWMDSARGVAILLVLAQHAVTVPMWDGYTGSPALEEFNRLFQPYRMPLLLMLSGLLLHRSLAKPLPVYASGKIRRIVWPLLLWTPIVWLLSPPETLTIVSVGTRHLWFLVVLAGCYTIALLTRWVSPWLIAAGMLFYSVLLPDLSSFAMTITSNGVFFMVGAGLGTVLPRWQSIHGGVIAALGTIAIAWSVMKGWYLHADVNVSITVAMSLLGAAVVLWIAPRLPAMPAMQWIGRNSLVFYVAHAPVMIALWGVLRRAEITNPHAVTVILLAVTGPLCVYLARAWWAQGLFTWPARRGTSRQEAVGAALPLR